MCRMPFPGRKGQEIVGHFTVLRVVQPLRMCRDGRVCFAKTPSLALLLANPQIQPCAMRVGTKGVSVHLY